MKLAESALKRAENVLATGVATAELKLRVRQVREALDPALADSQLLVELDRIHLETGTNPTDWAEASARKGALLRTYGVDLAVPAAAAARINASRLRERLLAAVDNTGRGRGGEEFLNRTFMVLWLAEEKRPDAFWVRWRATQDGSMGGHLDRPALVRIAKGDIPGASRQFQGFFPIDPKDAGIRNRLVDAVKSKGDVEAAIREFQAALWNSPKGAFVHRPGRAMVAKKKEDIERAIRCYRAVLLIDPKDHEIRNNLADALEATGDVKGAMRERQAAVEAAIQELQAAARL